MGHKQFIDLSTLWEKNKMGETAYYCKKHRDTQIKFVEMTTEGKLRHFHYYCPECEKEKRRK